MSLPYNGLSKLFDKSESAVSIFEETIRKAPFEGGRVTQSLGGCSCPKDFRRISNPLVSFADVPP